MKREIGKFLKVCFAVAVCFTLTGCELEESGATLENETTAMIGQNSVTELKKVEMKDVSLKHNETIDGKEVILVPNYAIEKSRAENWLFTQSSSVELGLGIESLPKGYNVMVSQVYADISLLSKYAKYNGIRQDSINIEYFSLPNGGISINEENGFMVPFQIEAVDKSEKFFYMWYGYGSGSLSRITESDLSESVQGAVLNVVWTLLFENEQTGEQFVKTINDRVGIPYDRSEDVNDRS